MPESFCQTEPPNAVARQFVQAVNARNSDDLDQLLRTHPDLRRQIDQPWFAFDSPAILAAKDSRPILKILLKHGANINQRSNWWAGSFGVLDGASPEMAQFLIERGARLDIHSAAEQGKTELVAEFLDSDPALVDARGGDGQTPMHVALDLATVDLLLQHGADLTIRCLDHSATAVQYSVSNPEKCRQLILSGAQPDIFLACALGDRELVERVLVEEPDALSTRVGHCRHTRPVDRRSHLHIYFWKLLGAATPLDVAREFHHPKLYQELFQRSPAKQQFLAACWEGEQEKVKRVVAQSPDVFQQLDDDEQKELARAAWEGRLESVRVMLEFGFDPHLPGDENSTPLDRAAFHGHREIVELLLDYDPDPPLGMKNQYGGVPLDCCAYGATYSWKNNTDHVGTARALLAAGAKIDPAWLPIENKAIDQLFRDHLDR